MSKPEASNPREIIRMGPPSLSSAPWSSAPSPAARKFAFSLLVALGRGQPAGGPALALDGPAAIGRDHLAGDIGGGVAGEEAGDAGDLRRLGQAAHGHALQHPFLLEGAVPDPFLDQLG